MKTLIEYFKNNPTNDLEYWNTDLNCYHISGFAILPDILKLNPQKILDLGCGYNEFKRYIPNLIGIDFANENADIVDDFMNYECEDNSIDVMLALGSINFGNHELVDKQMEWMTKKLRRGGKMFIRVNPAEAPDDSIGKQFYIWTIKDIYDFSVKYSLEVEDNNIKLEDRIPSELIRGGSGFANCKLYWKYIKK
jgi:hypothetical protein